MDNVLNVLVNKNRGKDIENLTIKLHREHVKHPFNSPESIALGEAYKQSLDITKHNCINLFLR